MIKKILSLFIASVLLLSATSCSETGTNSNPDSSQLPPETGPATAGYIATYEETKNALDVINGREVDISKSKVILLDSFVNECELVYYFVRSGDRASGDGLEEFVTAPEYLDSLSYVAIVFLGECSHEGEDQDHRVVYYLMPPEYAKDHRSSVIFWSSDKIIEAPNPELWTVEKDDRNSLELTDTWSYKFIYDGKVIHRVFSCFELDDGMLEKFRQDIINAYLPAAE